MTYFDEPLDYIHIKHRYLTIIKPNYDITECTSDCVDDVISLDSGNIITDDFYDIITEDNFLIGYRTP